MKHFYFLFITIFMLNIWSFGQMQEYNYKSPLSNISISQQWHQIDLPNEIYGNIKEDFSDLRIYGITAENDTIEAPYLIRQTSDIASFREFNVNILNTSKNKEGYFFTLEVPSSDPINKIELDFEEQNFDWRLRLKGSNDQQEWFVIEENYRILSIKNTSTDYHFTTVKFPESNYRYYRMRISGTVSPTLLKAKISNYILKKGVYRDYSLSNFTINHNKQKQITEVIAELPMPVPVSHIEIDVADSIDYYRPFSIAYLTDSIETEKGWIENYNNLSSAVLSSVEDAVFTFANRNVQKLKITIQNNDNQPLEIDSIRIKGYVFNLAIRLLKEANYYLVYGNKKAKHPNYDIVRFTQQLPSKMQLIEVGESKAIQKEAKLSVSPIFENKMWLWAVMGVVILLLGGFTLKMMKKS